MSRLPSSSYEKRRASYPWSTRFTASGSCAAVVGCECRGWKGSCCRGRRRKYPCDRTPLVAQRQLLFQLKDDSDWETFIAIELVNYVDSHYERYRPHGAADLQATLMGGYGTFRIGISIPKYFESVFDVGAHFERPEVTPASLQ